MARKIIPLVNGEVYHIFNRGVDKRDVFLDKNDYIRFYQSLNLFNTVEPVVNFLQARRSIDKQSSEKLVKIHAYSLLSNHYHMLVEQIADDGISEFIKRVSGGFTSHFNEKYNRSGALFQGRFKRVHIDNDEQYRYVFAYVNENHYVHNVVRADDICYSSSMYFQRKSKCKIIDLPIDYDVLKAQALAQDIYHKRHGDTFVIE